MNFTLLGLTHTDAQGGLKGFNQRGKSFLASTRVNRFLFDTEFIYKASLESDVLIKDMPADLRDNVHLPNMHCGVLAEELKNLFLIAWRGYEDYRGVNNPVENPVNNGKRTKEKRDTY